MRERKTKDNRTKHHFPITFHDDIITDGRMNTLPSHNILVGCCDTLPLGTCEEVSMVYTSVPLGGNAPHTNLIIQGLANN